MARILITGANGLLGSTLAPLLESHLHVVLRHGYRSDAQIRADLSNFDQAVAALNQACPDVIVNLAAATNVDDCERLPQHAYRSNVRIVENLARWIGQMRPDTYLIHMSTDQVYDRPGPHDEEDVTVTNYYALSKYAGELAAATVPSTVVRTNFFGPSHSPNRVSFSDWIIGALIRGERLCVFDDVLFSPLSTDRLCAFVQLMIERRIRGVFNVGSNAGKSKADFAYALANMLGIATDSMVRATSSQAHLVAYRPKDMRMDCGRFERAFSLCLPTLEEEIESMRSKYQHETRPNT